MKNQVPKSPKNPRTNMKTTYQIIFHNMKSQLSMEDSTQKNPKNSEEARKTANSPENP